MRNDECLVIQVLMFPISCIRKQYYSRKFPEMDPISNESVHHFVIGEASEFVITDLANMGVAQAELEMEGLMAHPDIMSEEKGEGGEEEE
jgi:hypothetical protein